jgi:hypothetical protein
VAIYEDLAEYDRQTKDQPAPDEKAQELWKRRLEVRIEGSEGWMMLESL